jgi:hypothetical protein
VIKELVLHNQPKRYLVYNSRYIVMVTYDKFVADEMEASLKKANYDSKLFPAIHEVKSGV